MKTSIHFFLVLLLVMQLFAGCSFSNGLSRFPSASEFYEKFNDKMKERAVEIVTKNDSIIISGDGAEAFNDTIFIIKKNVSKTDMSVPLKLIHSIQYSEYYADDVSGFIQLNDGNIYEAENIKAIPDSLQFSNLYRYETKTPFHVSEIERVTYTKHWIAVPAGFIGGFLTGIAVGFTGPLPIYEGSHGTIYSSPGPGRSKSIGNNVVICALSGCIIGAIAGYIIGFDYDYYFN
jgi:hypothetical protein